MVNQIYSNLLGYCLSLMGLLFRVNMDRGVICGFPVRFVYLKNSQLFLKSRHKLLGEVQLNGCHYKYAAWIEPYYRNLSDLGLIDRNISIPLVN